MKLLKSCGVLIAFTLINFVYGQSQKELWGVGPFGSSSQKKGKIYHYNLDSSRTYYSPRFPDTLAIGMVSSGVQPYQNGLLYGCIEIGPSTNGGCIFSYDPHTDSFQVVIDFETHLFGYGADLNLLLASNNKFYGCAQGMWYPNREQGVLFEFDPVGPSIVVKHRFNGTDGQSPVGGLIETDEGKLYGVTHSGGTYGNGVLFEYDLIFDTLNVKYNFNCVRTDSNCLCGPNAYLLLADNGSLYGSTQGIGISGGSVISPNYGAIYEYDLLQDTITKVTFMKEANIAPNGNMVQASNGKIYGTSNGGSTAQKTNNGTLFEYDFSGSIDTKFAFDGTPHGKIPVGGPIIGNDGKLYGTTSGGGLASDGVIYSYNISEDTLIKLTDLYSAYLTMNPLTEISMQYGGSLTQKRLSRGETPYQIYHRYQTPIDSFYGKHFQGGLISYVDTVTGLCVIAAPTDQPTNTFGGCGLTCFRNTGTARNIGSGLNDTKATLNQCRSGGAQNYTLNMSLSGYSDWFLPSIDELETFYSNLFQNGSGNFQDSSSYWSSTNVGVGCSGNNSVVPVPAYSFVRNKGVELETPPNTTLRVRAARYVPPITPATLSATTVKSDHNKAVAIANLTSDGGGLINESGFCYSTTGVPTITSKYVRCDQLKTGIFWGELINIQQGEKYYVRAYARNEAGIAYSNTINFVSGYTITTTIADTVMAVNSVIAGGDINSGNGVRITERGICWSPFPMPTKNNSYLKIKKGLGSYTGKITGLHSDSSYYVRAYAMQGTQITYGNQLKFKTADEIPINNNYIKHDVVSCSYFHPLPLQGSEPTGGSGAYTYTWLKYDKNTGWTSITPSSSAGQNYTPPRVHTRSLIIYRYKRVVSSMGLNDTSESVTYTYYPTGFPDNPIITEQQAFNGTILSASYNEPLGNFQAQWYKYDLGWTPVPNGNTTQITIDSANPKHFYQVHLTYGNGCPTSVSKTISFTSPDGQGNTYPTVLIGTQYWMMKNLRTKIGREITQDGTWSQNSSVAHCWYNNDQYGTAFKYGALYNGYIVNTDICPDGWRIPTIKDWETLNKYVGGPDGIDAAWALKAVNEWKKPNDVAINGFNFSALPGGERSKEGTYKGLGTLGTWWALDENSELTYFEMVNISQIDYDIEASKEELVKEGHHIRCIKE